MIANLAVLKSCGFILPMTKLFDRGRVAAHAEPEKTRGEGGVCKKRNQTLHNVVAPYASFGQLFSVQVKFSVQGACSPSRLFCRFNRGWIVPR